MSLLGVFLYCIIFVSPRFGPEHVNKYRLIINNSQMTYGVVCILNNLLLYLFLGSGTTRVRKTVLSILCYYIVFQFNISYNLQLPTIFFFFFFLISSL